MIIFVDRPIYSVRVFISHYKYIQVRITLFVTERGIRYRARQLVVVVVNT